MGRMGPITSLWGRAWRRATIAGQVLFKGIGIDPQAFKLGLDLNVPTGNQMGRPFATSVWVQRAIKKVAGPIAAVELGFTTDGETEIESPELETFWKAPAKGLNGRADFIEASTGWLKLAGECFWLLDDRMLLPYRDGKLSQIVLARPDRMKHVVEDGKLLGWTFRDGQNRTFSLLPEQVIQLKNWNPYDDWRGLGEYEAAQIAAEADYAAGRFARNLAQSNGDQGVYVVAKGGIPDDAQREQITNQLRSKRRMQQQGQFVPVFLTGDVSIEDPKIKSPDGDFVNMRLQNRHEIFLAFGVPPSMADKMESYSIGSASDWFILIFETCIPTGSKLCGGIDQVVKLQTGQVVQSYFDWDEHPVMQAVRRERVSNAKDLWGMGMSMESINDYLSLGMKEFPGWEVGYLPFSVAPVGEAAPTKQPSEPAFSEDESQGGDLVGDAIRALKSKVQGPKSKTKSPRSKVQRPKSLRWRVARYTGERSREPIRSGLSGSWHSGGTICRRGWQ